MSDTVANDEGVQSREAAETPQEVNEVIIDLTEGHRDWYNQYYKGGLDPLSDDMYYDLLMAYIAGAAHGVRLANEEITKCGSES